MTPPATPPQDPSTIPATSSETSPLTPFSHATRRAGILVPLFSIPSTRSWGIGEIADIELVAGWLSGAGQRLLQLLPINEMTMGESSPYSAMSAMAIDPQFISMHRLEDFDAIGGEQSLSSHVRASLEAVRVSPTIAYRAIRDLKLASLRAAFTHFQTRELAGGTRRGAAFRAYVEQESWWLREYALFRALHARFEERPWSSWPTALRRREPDALAAARHALAGEVSFREYLQWVAGDQWGVARDRAGNVELFGDLPFMVSEDSADVWSRQDEFRLDATTGVPPDAFSEAGQDWGLPVYQWDVLAARGFDWLRWRARRNADLYEGYRVDHVVGFYRTYFRPRDGSPAQFTPADESAQLALGEQLIEVFRARGSEIVAEDLGTVPDFVRDSLTRLRVPGYKVLRWERHWTMEGQPFRDPADFPAASVATSGTHDTEPMVTWWAHASVAERAAVLAIPSIASRVTAEDREQAGRGGALSHAVREALLEALYASGSNLLVLPIQDVFGWADRINRPATVSDGNWTWRLPWPSDRLATEPMALSVASQLREWSRRHSR